AAYAGARIMNEGQGHVAVMAGALALTLVAAAVFAVVALRGTGLGFVMITVALGQIVWGVAYRWISLTNGDNGIAIRGRPSPLGLSLTSPAGFYWEIGRASCRERVETAVGAGSGVRSRVGDVT